MEDRNCGGWKEMWRMWRLEDDDALVFFFKVALAIWSLLWFHKNFRIIHSGSVKNALGILI